MEVLRDETALENAKTPEVVPVSKEKKPPSPEIFKYTVLALGIALFIRFFIATPYVVSGASMEPTFAEWEYLIVDKVVYALEPPQRGDVIVFTLPSDGNRSLIKRVIGLPGDTVRLSGSKVTIINKGDPKGFVLQEPYVSSANRSMRDSLEVTLREDEYFVLGDNRKVSADSRLWGKLPRANVTGRVDVRLFPFSEISLLPGKTDYLEK